MKSTSIHSPAGKGMRTSVLGYPRIGSQRELKKSTESFWKGNIKLDALEADGLRIREANWRIQNEAGIDIVPSNDFSFYDQMLDMCVLLGAIPERYGWSGGAVSLDTYFSMARGIQEKQGVSKHSVPAMEMTKWFDTNYHYIVPELQKNQRFKLSSDKPVREFKEALSMGIKTRPVLIGPVTFLMLGKCKGSEFSRFELLDSLVDVYASILGVLKEAGADMIQIDEPVLVLDLDREAQGAFQRAYQAFSKKVPKLDLILTTYFGSLGDNLDFVCRLPIQGLHIDLVRAPHQLNDILRKAPPQLLLSLGVVDGRNVWKTNLEEAMKILAPAMNKWSKDRLLIAPSCSLLHAPSDLDLEAQLDKSVKSWLAFAKQKLSELVTLCQALNEGPDGVARELKQNRDCIANRKVSKRIHVMNVKNRVRQITTDLQKRCSSFKARRPLQREKLQLPLFPTTTIGSFPQTTEIRSARASFKTRTMPPAEYHEFIQAKIKDAIKRQTDIGLDVLVHGEFERNDMVEYFGEQLEGFAFTQHGWVQSYGTRCVKPPIIFGDVSRPQPMTVDWMTYAQSLTEKPVKGMLTGPITILQWSFVRDDQPRSETARQIALAIRDEVIDLEKAGLRIIQIDEPAIREGLPLRKTEWAAYLSWAVECFKIASSGVQDETQIHTHMCYSEFNDIIESIAEMDADVISIETSRSQMELLGAFAKFRYPNEIGPGVYDIHSPRVPSEEEIRKLLKKAAEVLPVENIWVNPDCGLKTRAWKETALSLKSMVNAAKSMRELAPTNA